MKQNLKRLVVGLVVVIALLAVGSCTVTFSGPSYDQKQAALFK